MSSSSPIADPVRYSGQKMNFSHTCNLLSQYVKEKRSLSLPSHGGADGFVNRATMNLFPVSGKPPEYQDSNRCIGHSVNLFPQFSAFNHHYSAVPNPVLGKRGSPEPPAGQMTIFYNGQVMVFNDLPAEKAKEVMDLANSFDSSPKKRRVEAPVSPKQNPNPNPNLNMNPAVTVAQNINVAATFGSPMIPAAIFPQTHVANASDLPIARKASLHRFLEKRKDRLTGKVPDVLNEVASKPAEGKSWLGLGSLPVYQVQQQL